MMHVSMRPTISRSSRLRALNRAKMRCMTPIEYYLGTDMLVAAWILILSTVIYIVLLYYYFWTFDSSKEEDAVLALTYYSSLLCAAVGYLIGSLFYLRVSFHDELDIMLAENIYEIDVSKLSFCERNFTGNDLLLMAWAYFTALLCFYVYPIAALSLGEFPSSPVLGTFYLVLLVILSMFMILWIISCMPQNIQANHGKGSSYICGAWAFFVLSLTFLSLVSISLAVYSRAAQSVTGDVICQFFASVLFSLGASLFLYTSYPENHHSAFIYKCLCSKSSNVYLDFQNGTESLDDDEEALERIPLRSFDPVPDTGNHEWIRDTIQRQKTKVFADIHRMTT